MVNWEEIRELREQGYTLQAIGDEYGVTKERIRQLLTKHYGTTKLCLLLPRETFSNLVGCGSSTITRLETKGLIKPIHYNWTYLYKREDAEKVSKLVFRPSPFIEKTCEECGKKFSRRSSEFKPCSPGRFCSKYCQGVYLGKHHGKNRK